MPSTTECVDDVAGYKKPHEVMIPNDLGGLHLCTNISQGQRSKQQMSYIARIKTIALTVRTPSL